VLVRAILCWRERKVQENGVTSSGGRSAIKQLRFIGKRVWVKVVARAWVKAVANAG